ncbi:hypothetical protein ACLD72_016825 [Paenibacillus sp. TH7-28]
MVTIILDLLSYFIEIFTGGRNLSSSGKIVILLVSLIVGILIMFSPVFITGSYYNVNQVMGNLLSAELIVRTLAVVIGLIIIYDGVKTFFKN